MRPRFNYLFILSYAMRPRINHLLFIVFDLFLLNLTLNTAEFIYSKKAYSINFGVNLLYNIAWIITYLIYIGDIKVFKVDLNKMIKLQFKKYTLFIALLCISLISFGKSVFPKGLFFGSISTFFFSSLIFYILFFYFTESNPKYYLKPAIIISNTSYGNYLYKFFKRNYFLGVNPIGIITDNSKLLERENFIGLISDFYTIIHEKKILDVFIALSFEDVIRIKKIIKLSEKKGLNVHLIPLLTLGYGKSFSVEKLGNISFLRLRKYPLEEYSSRFWKRAFDLIFSFLAIVILLPAFIVITILIKIDSKGPVFYKPVRLGINGSPFILYKFRSMCINDDLETGILSTVKDDPRLTRLGKTLRRFNLDELPQLINVLLNEMSLVGPRPHRKFLNEQLQEKINFYMTRHLIKPGITGWAQVNGWRGPTETKIDYWGRTLHDLWYLENWNFWLDLYIIFLTVFGKKAKTNAF